jgi:hypothetical protein
MDLSEIYATERQALFYNSIAKRERLGQLSDCING